MLLDSAPMNANHAQIVGLHDHQSQGFDELANLCKASADLLRLQILRVLQGDSFAVSELCSIFAVRQPALSHHLKLLASADLVTTRREGNSIFYRRSLGTQIPSLEPLHSSLFDAVDAIELPQTLIHGIEQVYALRAANSRDFFTRNAAKFTQQQDLIASYQQYAATVAQVLADAPLGRRQSVLEVGPGDGAFLEVLSAQFARVVALDNAEEMLGKAKQHAQQKDLSNITFIHGDTSTAELRKLQVDCVVINMVLHHTPSPGQIFKDVANTLAPGGLLLVTDLCHHDQAWVRENCGDIWLGFEPADLNHYAADAGLEEFASQYLAQRNGFQIQVRLYGHHSQQGSTDE